MKILFILFLITFVNGIRILCDFYSVSKWYWPVYICRTLFIDASRNPNYLTRVSGNHKRGYSNNDVTYLKLVCDNSNILKVFPKGLLNIFPNLAHISIGGCPIILNGDELRGIPNLESFAFYNSNLTRIPGNLFKPTQQIRLISFHDNQIEHVGEGLLNYLQDLELAGFENNKCIDFEFGNIKYIHLLKEMLRKSCPDVVATTTEVGELIEATEIEAIIDSAITETSESLTIPNEPLSEIIETTSERGDQNIELKTEGVESTVTELLAETIEAVEQQNDEPLKLSTIEPMTTTLTELITATKLITTKKPSKIINTGSSTEENCGISRRFN